MAWRSSLSRRRRRTWPSSQAASAAWARAQAASSRSRSRTGSPAFSVTAAMPLPMSPPPSTPTRSTGRAFTAGSATPLSFLRAVCAKKISTSRRDTPVTASSPKRCASSTCPAWKPCARPWRTTSRARSGAG